MCAVIYVCPTCSKTKPNTTTKTHSSRKISWNFSTLSCTKSCLKMFTIVLGKLPNILQYITVKTTGDKSSQNIWFGWDGNNSKPRRQDRLNPTCNNSNLGIATKSHYQRCLTSCFGGITTGSRNTLVFFLTLAKRKAVQWAIRKSFRSLSTHQNASALGNTDTLPINTCSPKRRCSGQYGHLADHYLLTKMPVRLAIRAPYRSLPTHQNASAVGNTDTLPITTYSPKSSLHFCKCISPVVHHM